MSCWASDTALIASVFLHMSVPQQELAKKKKERRKMKEERISFFVVQEIVLHNIQCTVWVSHNNQWHNMHVT